VGGTGCCETSILRNLKRKCGGTWHIGGFCVKVGFLRTLGVGVAFFYLTPATEVQFNHVLHRTPKLRILTLASWNGTISFKTLFKQIMLAAYHHFHWLLVATKLLTAKLHSGYRRRSPKFWKGRSVSQTFHLRLRNPDCHANLSKEGQRVAKVLFDNCLTGDFTVFEDRLLNKWLQLFTHRKFIMVYHIFSYFLRSTLLLNRNKHAW